MKCPTISSITRVLCAITFAALLTGCSGGSSSSSGTDPIDPPTRRDPPPEDPSHPTGNVGPCCATLDSNKAVVSPFGGVGIRTGSDGSLVVSQNYGTLTHDTGAINYNDEIYTLLDANGFQQGVANDGADGTLEISRSQFSDEYDYLIPTVFSYTENGERYTTTGFAGIVTDSNDMPTTGGAVYVGEAAGSMIASGDYFELNGGTSTLTASFETGLVNATFDSFDPTGAPIDSVQIVDMTISGSTFSEGAVITSMDGVGVDVTGSNTISNTEGMFFGWDDGNGIPDELAGSSVSKGDDGFLLMNFTGD